METLPVPSPAIDLNYLFAFAPGGQTSHGLETQEDSEKMWTTYMEEVREIDGPITDSWQLDATALVVFTGLFATVVTAFLIESYKKLSPDIGNQTIVLLGQISQQLANSTNGASSTTAAIQPSSSSTLIVCVNAMWLLSLVFSIASALLATSLQQWARRYIQMPHIPDEPHRRARVREFLYLGTQKYKMRQVVGIPPMLLHISVFLFFVGLVMFFCPIHKTLAIILSICAGLFGVAYLVLTILPCIKHNCPYRTPMTAAFWYAGHIFLISVAFFVRWVLVLELQGYRWLFKLFSMEHIVAHHIAYLGDAIQRHWKSLKDALKVGLENTTLNQADNAPIIEERRMLTWLFGRLAQADKARFRWFMDIIPRSTITQLMTPPIESGKMALREPLLTLLRSGATGTRAVGHDVYMHRRSLLVCLDAVRHVAEALVVPNGVLESQAWNLAHDVRTNFANLGLMRAMWADPGPDAAIRVTSRSICALLAKYFMHRGQLEGLELAWLQEITEETPNVIHNSLGDFAVLDHMNLKSFVYNVLSPGDLPIESAATFTKTLAILMDVGIQPPFDRTVFNVGLVGFIQQVENEVPRGIFMANKLRQMYESILEP